MDREKQLTQESAATAALIAYYQAISNTEKYSPQDIQKRLDAVAAFGKETELRAYQLHLEYLAEHTVPKAQNCRKLTLRRTDRLITKRHNLKKKVKEEIARLRAELAAETSIVCTRSTEVI